MDLTGREETAPGSVTFTFEPADDTPVTPAEPGQFISLRMPMADGVRQVRQYTLSGNVADTSRRTVTVKLDPNGEFTPILHTQLKVGDTIEISNPYGDLVIDHSGEPLVIATAGIGCTPSAAALATLAESNSQRSITVLHADQEADTWALRARWSNPWRSCPTRP